MLNEGVVNGKRLFPAAVVQKIRAGGDPAKFGTAYPALTGGSYTTMWWIYPGNDEVFAARGVHGQTIYVNPAAQMVLVRFASFPRPENPLSGIKPLKKYRNRACFASMRQPSYP